MSEFEKQNVIDIMINCLFFQPKKRNCCIEASTPSIILQFAETCYSENLLHEHTVKHLHQLVHVWNLQQVSSKQQTRRLLSLLETAQVQVSPTDIARSTLRRNERKHTQSRSTMDVCPVLVSILKDGNFPYWYAGALKDLAGVTCASDLALFAKIYDLQYYLHISVATATVF